MLQNAHLALGRFLLLGLILGCQEADEALPRAAPQPAVEEQAPRPPRPYTGDQAQALLSSPQAIYLSGMGETALLNLTGALDAPGDAQPEPLPEPQTFGPPPFDPDRNTPTHSRDPSGPVCATQSETIVLPGDNGKVVAAYNSSRGACGTVRTYTGYAVSLDHGVTWRDMGTPPALQATQGNSGDPVLARDRAGNIYLSMISPTGLGVARMAPERMDFEPWVEAAIGRSGFADKEWLLVAPDPRVPGRDNIYLAWIDFGSPVAFRMSRSTDGGRSFRAMPSFTLPCPSCQGVFLAADAQGTIHAFHLDFRGTPPMERMVQYRRSRDAGDSWTAPITAGGLVRAARESACGRDSFIFAGTAQRAVRYLDFPSAAVHPLTGEIVVTYSDGRGGDADILMAASSDGGNTWKAPLRINTLQRGDQFMPGVTADDRGFYFQWYSADRALNQVTVRGRYRLGGVFYPEQQLSSTAFPVQVTNPNGDSRIAGCYWGDYNQPGVGDYVHHIWGDTRNELGGGNQPDVYTVRR